MLIGTICGRVDLGPIYSSWRMGGGPFGIPETFPPTTNQYQPALTHNSLVSPRYGQSLARMRQPSSLILPKILSFRRDACRQLSSPIENAALLYFRLENTLSEGVIEIERHTIIICFGRECRA